jgi:hypothetical protein
VSGNVKAVNFVSTSDRRLKKNISAVDGLAAILRLKGVMWNWKDSGQTDMGVIAQDVEKVFPHSVVTDPTTGYKAVKYNSLIAPLIESTKELYGMCSDSIASLEGRVSQLENENRDKSQEIQKLKAENEQVKARLDRIERMLLSK